jgi:hypothetical protein
MREESIQQVAGVKGVSERCTWHLVYTFTRDWQELKRKVDGKS